MNTTIRSGFAVALLAAASVAVTGCDNFLDVKTPYTIAAASVDPVNDALAFSSSSWQNYVEALGDFAVYEAWFTNSLRVGDTFPTRNEFGRRFIDDRTNGTLNTELWTPISTAVASAEDGLVLLEELDDSNINRTRLYLTSAFGSLTMAESFCTGVIREGPGAPSPELTKSQMLEHAIERFQQTISSGTANGTADGVAMANAARVGLARAHLFHGDLSAVAGDVSAVPAGFQYNATYVDDPGNRGRLGNTVFAFSGRTANRESGVVGPEWRALGQGVDVSSTQPFAGEVDGDARVSWRYEGRTAQDGVHAFVFQTTHDGWDAPLVVASELEARYLVQQASGTEASRIALINERRAANGQPTMDAGDFTGPDAVLEELLFQKSLDFWLTARRMADWRWYTGDGATARGTHFRYVLEPTDAYYKPEVGGMGDQVCFPLPYNEYSRNTDINR